jgi:hypothetical protein
MQRMPKRNTCWVWRGLMGLWLFSTVWLCVPATSLAEERQFELRVVEGVLQGEDVVRVTEGDTLRIMLDSDRPLTVHLHGYDLEVSAAPGAPGELVFEAEFSGRFPVEIHAHGSDADHGTLAYVEVLPR